MACMSIASIPPRRRGRTCSTSAISPIPPTWRLSPDQRFLYSVHGDERLRHRLCARSRDGPRQARQPRRHGRQQRRAPGHRPSRQVHGGRQLCQRHRRGDGDRAGRLAEGSAPAGGAGGRARAASASQQTGPLPHDIVFDPSGRYVLVPDKGLDRVFAFRFDADSGRLTPTEQGSVQTRPGAGPRHLAFHPRLPIVWVLNELDSTTTTYRWDAATGVPGAAAGHHHAADRLHRLQHHRRDRGHAGRPLRLLAPTAATTASPSSPPTPRAACSPQSAGSRRGGARPRFIGLDPAGRFLYAANEQGDTVVAFHVDAASGKLTPTGQAVPIATPVTIVFAGR